MARPRVQDATRSAGRYRWAVLAAVLLVAAAVGATVVAAVGALGTVPMSGQPTADLRVAWLLPATRLAGDVGAAVTVGCLMAAACLLPGAGTVSPAGYRWLRCSTWWAAAWAVASAAAVPGILAEFLNAGLGVASPAAVASFVWSIPEGRSQLAVTVLAGAVAIGSRWVLTVAGARALLAAALLAVVPPAVVEYVDSDDSPPVAVASLVGMVLHMTGALTWAGALAALALVRRLPVADLGTAVRRFSRIAPGLALAVGAAGGLTAAVELRTPGQLLSTDFGRVVLLKTAAFAGLVLLGWLHRRCSLPALAAGRRGVFRRIVAAELLVFAVAVGLAVGLSRTAPPDAYEPPAAATTPG